MSILEDALKDMQGEAPSRPYLAEVIEVVAKGVKLRLFGEEEPRETYYNSIANVGKGDTAYINYIGDTILIIGKLLY